MDTPTEYDRAHVRYNLMDANHGCHVRDRLMCSDCDIAAAQIVSTLRAAGRLGPSPGTVFTHHALLEGRIIDYLDIRDDDPDINLIRKACELSCLGWGGEPVLAAKWALAALRTYSRLSELIVGHQARELFGILQRTGAINFVDTPLKMTDHSLSNFYIDMRIIANPEDLWKLASLYADTIIDEVGLDGFDTVFGPAYGAVPLAVVTSQVLWQHHGVHKPHSTMRQEEKAYGKGGLLLGPSIEGRRIAMVDDVMTSSATKIKNYERITQHNGLLVVTVVGVDRTIDPGIVSNLADTTQAPVRALATLTDLAKAQGFSSWADCETHRGRQPVNH